MAGLAWREPLMVPSNFSWAIHACGAIGIADHPNLLDSDSLIAYGAFITVTVEPLSIGVPPSTLKVYL